MKCTQCGSDNVLVESVGDNRSKKTCQNCGYSEIVDREGRRMLTDDIPQPDRSRYLVEG